LPRSAEEGPSREVTGQDPAREQAELLTEKLRASEDALRASEERLRLTLETTHVGTWRVDLRTNQETRDANLNRIFGLVAEETVRPRGDFLQYLHPEDRERVRGLTQRHIQETGARDIKDVYRIVRPDGSVRWVRLRGQLLPGDDGAPWYVTGVVVDVTDMRRAEEQREELLAREKAARAQAEAERLRLERLFRGAPALVNTHRGPEHVFELVHPLTFKLLGNRELIGKPVREAIPELEGQGVFELMDRVYQTGEPVHETARPARLDRTGTGKLEDVFFDFTYQPVRDGEGRVTGVASFALISSSVGSSSVPQGSFLSQPRPNRPTSSPRRAFWNDSRKVRPIAMTSPTDFIWVVRTGSASGNFSNAQRGTLVTT